MLGPYEEILKIFVDVQSSSRVAFLFIVGFHLSQCYEAQYNEKGLDV